MGVDFKKIVGGPLGFQKNFTFPKGPPLGVEKSNVSKTQTKAGFVFSMSENPPGYKNMSLSRAIQTWPILAKKRKDTPLMKSRFFSKFFFGDTIIDFRVFGHGEFKNRGPASFEGLEKNF